MIKAWLKTTRVSCFAVWWRSRMNEGSMSLGYGNQNGYPECFELTIESYMKIWKNLLHQEISPVTISVAGEMCDIYRRHARLDDLQHFLSSAIFVGNDERFCTNEKFARALVITRYRQQNFREVTRLLTVSLIQRFSSLPRYARAQFQHS
jgi:hypothetical protein